MRTAALEEIRAKATVVIPITNHMTVISTNPDHNAWRLKNIHGQARLVPNLKLKIGDEDVPVVFTDVVALNVAQGDYVDSASIAITFPSALRVFGFQTAAPSDVHKISCRTTSSGLICQISPLSLGSQYYVDVAVDQAGTPTVITASRDTVLIPLDDYVRNESRSWRARLFSKESIAPLGIGVVYVILIYVALKQFMRDRRRRRRLKFVGRLTSLAGVPISGASVRLRVDEPPEAADTYAAVTTDSEGDFIFEAGTKQEGLRGFVYVTHKDYEALELPFTNPILFLTLRPNPSRDSGAPELESSMS